MHDHIPEPDWKVLRDIKPLALDRLCQRILDEIVSVADNPDQGAHAKYGKIYGLIQERDEDIADAFNGFSRSRALFNLAIMNRLGLIKEDEFARFSQQTRNFLAKMRS